MARIERIYRIPSLVPSRKREGEDENVSVVSAAVG
jgi:hypothetical protein